MSMGLGLFGRQEAAAGEPRRGFPPGGRSGWRVRSGGIGQGSTGVGSSRTCPDSCAGGLCCARPPWPSRGFVGYQPWPEALWFGASLLPLGISLVPVMWICPPAQALSDVVFDRQWRVIAAVFAWLVVSFPFAMGIVAAVWWLGGMHS